MSELPADHSADGRPLLCLDCGERRSEPMGTYRLTARSMRDLLACGACGEGPLVDVRERSVQEALVTRRAQQQLARSRRFAAKATCIAAVLAVPVAFAASPFQRGVLAAPVLILVTICVMALAACFQAYVHRAPAAIEREMRRGWAPTRAAARLVAAAVLTLAIPNVGAVAFPEPEWADGWQMEGFARQAERLVLSKP
jgi:hypothetical protein